MIYNVKTIEFPDSLQVRVYAKPVRVSSHIQSRRLDNNAEDIFPICPETEKAEGQSGHSLQCSLNRTVNSIYAISRSNKWGWFVTLTINPKRLDSTDYIRILDKLGIWLNNIRKRYAPDLRYLFVPELHKDGKKYHFHGLIADVGNLPFEFSNKVSVGKYIFDYARKPYGTKIYNLPLWKWGYSTATAIHDPPRAGSYICKYITKELTHSLKNQRRFIYSQNLDMPVERVYNCDYDILSDIMKRYIGFVDYAKTVKVAEAGQEITYMEFNKNDKTTVFESIAGTEKFPERTSRATQSLQ